MSHRTVFGTAAIAAMLSMAATPLWAPTWHIGSGSIDGSLCIGNDCPPTPAFGFDTLRMQENNLRIHFDDTSVAASFPPNDWRIYANDSANGGSSYFGVEDATAGRFVFRVFAGARSNALTVDSQGDVGLGTTTPALDIDIKTGDTPSIRLQQDGTSGFTPQSWDMAGNEVNWFVRDATGGSQLPLRIRVGAPTSAVDIGANGDIGFGTAPGDSGSGNKELRVRSNDGAGKYGQLTFVRGSNDVFGVGADNGNFYIFGYEVNGGAGANVLTVNRTTGEITLRGDVTVAAGFTLTGDLVDTTP